MLLSATFFRAESIAKYKSGQVSINPNRSNYRANQQSLLHALLTLMSVFIRQLAAMGNCCL
jgi:hypothetical protein